MQTKLIDQVLKLTNAEWAKAFADLIPEHLTDSIDQIPGHRADSIDKISEHWSDQTSEHWSDRISEHWSDQTSEHWSDSQTDSGNSGNNGGTNDDLVTNDDLITNDDLVTNDGGGTYDDFVIRVTELVNIERSRFGLDPLQIDSQLNQAAQVHSENMAYQDFFSHTGRDGSRASDRIRAAGYDKGYTGENIAAGQTTPEAVVAAWMGSAGHRENILRDGFDEIGVGYVYLENDTGNVNYNHYWTQTFGG